LVTLDALGVMIWLIGCFIHFPVVPNLEHAIRHTVGLLWTSDQPVSETSTYTGQHNT
jgi:hypothetical protein